MSELPPDPARIAARLAGRGRILLAGASGSGKSTLLRLLAERLGWPAVTADPGRPAFGPPGAVARATHRGDAWHVERVEGIATLDAARFRLPLMLAAARVVPDGPVLVDAPGVHEGMAAAELLTALVEATQAELVLWFGADPHADLAAIVPIEPILPSPHARVLSPTERVQVRTEAWDAWLRDAREVVLPALPVVGAPPPPDRPKAWAGRQVVVRDAAGDTLTLGEIVTIEPWTVRSPLPDLRAAASLCVRDAVRLDGALRTAPAPAPRHRGRRRDLRGPLTLPGPRGAAASRLQCTLLGGVLGDPTLQVRFVGEPTSVLIDVGDVTIPPALAHHVTHLLLSHAHLDHFAGFVRLLRRRIGHPSPVTVFGPLGVTDAIHRSVSAVTWDRIGDLAPQFRIGEITEPFLLWTDLRAGAAPVSLGAEPLAGGIVHRDDRFLLRTATLDHGIPVLAWAVEEPRQVAIRRDGLQELGLKAGAWLGAFRKALAAGDRDAPIFTPGGVHTVRSLERHLAVWRPGRRTVYATDFGDTPGNRRALGRLARDADVLVCEATFLEEDADRARATGHLTTRAAGEIAAEAGVGLLAPFHFSARYQGRLDDWYAELRAAFGRVWDPRA